MPNRLSTEERKQLLITQGAMFRSGIVSCREKLKSGLRAESLAHGVMRLIGLTAFTAWRERPGLAASLPALAPVLLGAASKLWRKPAKPLVRGALVAGAIVTVAAVFFTRIKKRKQAAAEAVQEDELAEQE